MKWIDIRDNFMKKGINALKGRDFEAAKAYSEFAEKIHDIYCSIPIVSVVDNEIESIGKKTEENFEKETNKVKEFKIPETEEDILDDIVEQKIELEKETEEEIEEDVIEDEEFEQENKEFKKAFSESVPLTARDEEGNVFNIAQAYDILEDEKDREKRTSIAVEVTKINSIDILEKIIEETKCKKDYYAGMLACFVGYAGLDIVNKYLNEMTDGNADDIYSFINKNNIAAFVNYLDSKAS